MGKAADLVEQAVQETLTYYGFPDIHWQKIRTNNPLERIMNRSGAEPEWSVPSQTVSPVSTWRQPDYATSPEQHGRPNATRICGHSVSSTYLKPKPSHDECAKRFWTLPQVADLPDR